MSTTINQISGSQINDSFLQAASLKRINSAADDAAGLAIAEKMDSQVTGLARGTDNALDMMNLLRTAEGGLSGIEDSLQRIRELSLQAANGIYGDDEKAILQNEISELLKGINDTANNTQFNNMRLLDGSFTDKNVASSPDGSGMAISISDMRASALGLEGYDVTGDFDISVLDEAISAVSSARSDIGALSNRLGYTIDANNLMMLNQAAAKSRIEDADIGKLSMDLSRDRILSEVQIYSQKQQQSRMGNALSLLL